MDIESSEFDELKREEDQASTNQMEKNKEGPSAASRQHVAALIAHFGAVLMAEVWSYSATALPSMREGEQAMELSPVHEDWMASITFLGGALGSFLSGFITQKFGVKGSLVIFTLPILLSWILIGFATNIGMLLVGRFMSGAFVAGIGVSNILIAEICQKERRGRLNFLFDMSICVGVLLVYIFGAFFNWRVQAGLCAGQCVLFLFLLTQIYESPRFLLEKGRKAEAARALDYYHDMDASDELQAIMGQIEMDRQAELENRKLGQKRGLLLKFLMDPTVLKPIYIALSLQFVLQLCGSVPIICYVVDVFKQAGSRNETLSSCIFGLVNLLATIGGYFCIDRWGRRALLMLSESILTLTLFGLGLFLHFKDSLQEGEEEYYSWLPLAFFLIYIVAYSLGVGPIPWVVMGEVVNPKAKGFSNGVIIFFARLFGFLSLFYFKDLVGYLGQPGVYWMFSGVCLAGFLFSCFLLPETRGKDLKTIQAEIQQKWIHFP